MVTCCASGCNSTSSKPGNSFFKFPLDNKYILKQWVTNIKRKFGKRKNFFPTKATRLCQLHFEQECFDNRGDRQFLASIGFNENTHPRLNPGVVPTIFTYNEKVLLPLVAKAAIEKRRRQETISSQLNESASVEQIASSSSVPVLVVDENLEDDYEVTTTCASIQVNANDFMVDADSQTWFSIQTKLDMKSKEAQTDTCTYSKMSECETSRKNSNNLNGEIDDDENKTKDVNLNVQTESECEMSKKLREEIELSDDDDCSGNETKDVNLPDVQTESECETSQYLIEEIRSSDDDDCSGNETKDVNLLDVQTESECETSQNMIEDIWSSDDDDCSGNKTNDVRFRKPSIPHCSTVSSPPRNVNSSTPSKRSYSPSPTESSCYPYKRLKCANTGYSNKNRASSCSKDSDANPRIENQTVSIGINFIEKILQEFETIKAQQATTQRLLQRLLSEKERPVSNSGLEHLKLPVKTLERLNDLEVFISKSENSEAVVSHLGGLGGSNVADTTRRILSRLITNSLAHQFNWAGTNKLAFQKLRLRDVVINSVRAHTLYKNAVEINIENAIKDWLKHSTTRLKSEAKRSAQFK